MFLMNKMHQGHLTFVTSYIDNWHFPVTYYSFQSRNFLLHFLWSHYNKDFLILTLLLYLTKKNTKSLSIILYLQPLCWWLTFMCLGNPDLVWYSFFHSVQLCSHLQFLEDEEKKYINYIFSKWKECESVT